MKKLITMALMVMLFAAAALPTMPTQAAEKQDPIYLSDIPIYFLDTSIGGSVGEGRIVINKSNGSGGGHITRMVYLLNSEYSRFTGTITTANNWPNLIKLNFIGRNGNLIIALEPSRYWEIQDVDISDCHILEITFVNRLNDLTAMTIEAELFKKLPLEDEEAPPEELTPDNFVYLDETFLSRPLSVNIRDFEYAELGPFVAPFFFAERGVTVWCRSSGSVTYLLDSKYSRFVGRFTGKSSIDFGGLSGNYINRGDTYLTFKNRNGVVIAEIRVSNSSQLYDVDISGAHVLEIRFINSRPKTQEIAIADAYFIPVGD